MSNPYDILGVSKDAGDDEIKKAFRKRSLELHPDRNTDKDTTDEFQNLNAAFDKIKTGELRQQTEMESHNMGGMHQQQAGDFQDINHIFNMMFGGGMQGGMPGGMHGMHGMPGGMPGMPGGMPGVRIFHGGIPGGMPGHHFFHQQMQKPPAIIKSCEITLEQCFQGCSIPIEFERWSVENGVRGTRKEILQINIPPGIEENETLIMRDIGNAIDDQQKGDIKLNIHVKPHELFQRHGLDLVYKKTISLKESLCGCSFEIIHLNGKTLAINNLSNVTVIHPGFRRIVPQMGLRRDSVAGNLIIEFEIDFPKTLTSEQIEQLKVAF